MELMRTFIDEHVALLNSLALGLTGNPLSVTSWCARFHDQPVVLIRSENTADKGALGAVEIDHICKVFEYAAKKRWPILFYLNSAGARLSEGDGIQASFRKLLRSVLEFRTGGHRFIVLMGRNVFGGASLLAMGGDTRIYEPSTRVSMTGPRVLEKLSDNRNQDVSAIIAAENRIEKDASGVWAEGQSEVKRALIEALTRSGPNAAELDMAHIPVAEGPQNVSPRVHINAAGLYCVGTTAPSVVDLAALISAVTDWDRENTLTLTCEWPCHSLNTQDENAYQSYLLYGLSEAIYHKVDEGCEVICHFAEDVSGGLYIALASASTEVTASANVKVQALPYGVVDQIIVSGDVKKVNVELIALKIIDRIEG